jgi:hypothetical protein
MEVQVRFYGISEKMRFYVKPILLNSVDIYKVKDTNIINYSWKQRDRTRTMRNYVHSILFIFGFRIQRHDFTAQRNCQTHKI